MKPLETEFTYRGFAYRQIAREGDIALFEQKKESHKRIFYEVVKVRRHDGFKIAGKTCPPAEYYPSDHEWGTHGWSFSDRKFADRKYQELCTNTKLAGMA